MHIGKYWNQHRVLTANDFDRIKEIDPNLKYVQEAAVALQRAVP